MIFCCLQQYYVVCLRWADTSTQVPSTSSMQTIIFGRVCNDKGAVRKYEFNIHFLSRYSDINNKGAVVCRFAKMN